MTKPPGHLFVVQGDLSRLSCDGVVVPCDDQGNVSRWWFEMFHAEPQTGEAYEPLPDGALLRESLRGPIAHQLVDTVTARGDVEQMVAAVQDGMYRLAGDVDRRAGEGRVVPLLALPLPGTGHGGLASRRGAVVRALVPRLSEAAGRLGVDIALVTPDGRDYSAVQGARQGIRWDLSAALLEEADRLGRVAAAGQLSVFVGAGASVPLGLPGWVDLVEELLRRARLPQLPQDAEEPALLDAASRAREELGAAFDDAVGEILAVSHHALGHGLVASLGVRQNVTTNLDRALELAMETTHPDLRVLTNQWAGQRAPWLLKLHGTAGQGEVVLTTEDYERHRTEAGAPLYALVQGLLMTSHLLFVGFSLKDSNYLELAEPVAALYARAGGADQVATALDVRPLTDEQRVLDEAFHHPVFSGPEDDLRQAARALEIFLDRLAWRAATLRAGAHSYLLDQRYADLVEGEQERRLKTALSSLEDALLGLEGDAVDRARSVLRDFGAGEHPTAKRDRA